MSLALAGVLAAPRRARPFAALLGLMLALGVGVAVISVGWHFPSDVIAGYLLATAWALGLTAALYEADRRFPARERRASSAIARASDKIATGGLTFAAAGATVVVVITTVGLMATDADAATCFAREHTAFVARGRRHRVGRAGGDDGHRRAPRLTSAASSADRVRWLVSVGRGPVARRG